MNVRAFTERAGLLASGIFTLSLAFPVSADRQVAYEQIIECGTDAETGVNVCKVDKKTYIGWRTYSSNCLRCHGQDGVGSTFAPSLIERLKVTDKARFMKSVAEGYTGQIGVMPPWKDNPNVAKRYEQLWGYLSARSDGRLGAGRPKRIDR